MAQTLSRAAIGRAAGSPFVHTTTARSATVKLARKVRYELDGGDRGKATSFKLRTEPRAVWVCVPGQDKVCR